MKRQNSVGKRYYDIRLVLIFTCLLFIYVGFNYILSIKFNYPIIAEWIEDYPGHWILPFDRLRISLFFFELYFGPFIAALFCGDAEKTNSRNMGLWICSTMALPIIVNFVPNLWIWITYSSIMIISGWILGIKTGFVLPIRIKDITENFKKQTHNLTVDSPKLGQINFRGKSSIIIIAAGLIIPLAFAIYFYFSALSSPPTTPGI